MKTVTFNPDLPPILGLYARWLPLYIGQSKMDDDEAEPFQAPLCELEKAIADQPITTMQEFYLQQTAQTCVGTMCSNFDNQQRDALFAVAMAEHAERESLLALIDQHQKVFNATQTFPEDTGRATDDDPGFAALSNQEYDLLWEVIKHPTASISNIIVKGRYLAALRAVGGLGYENAEAFVDTFASIGRPA